MENQARRFFPKETLKTRGSVFPLAFVSLAKHSTHHTSNGQNMGLSQTRGTPLYASSGFGCPSGSFANPPEGSCSSQSQVSRQLDELPSGRVLKELLGVRGNSERFVGGHVE